MPNILDAYPGLRDFMTRRGLPLNALRSDGRLTLTIDGRYRVHLRPGNDARLVLTAKVMPLPGDRNSREAEQLLERLMNLGAGMLRAQASTLCLDTQEDSVQLQQSLAPGLNGEQLDAEIGEFTNALQFWVQTGNSL